MGLQKRKPKSRTRKKRISSFQAKRAIRKSKTELLLTKRLKQGDLASLVPLLESYNNLVKTVADHYRNQGIPIGELIHFGNIGLIKAAHRYDESKMVHFKSYSIWWIRQSILKALQELARIDQVPELLIMNLHRISQTFNSMEANSDIEPTDREIKEVVGIQIEEFSKVMNK